jgi:hypothetical protein
MSHPIIASLLTVIIVAATFAGCGKRHAPVTDLTQPAPAAAVSVVTHEQPPPSVVKASSEGVACPKDTVLVEGDYCEGVVHTCLESKPGSGCVRFKPSVAKCVGKVEHMRFCIDKYEWPNQAGSKPLLMQSWNDARDKCSSIGKRLCDDDEWTLACEGPDHLPYPYGWARDKTACNIDNRWIAPGDSLYSRNPAKAAAEASRLDKTVASGQYENCVSPYGVHDMTGNADEWTVNVTGGGKPYASYLKGGHWIGEVRNRCRPATESHSPSDVFYDFGFRCCANVT